MLHRLAEYFLFAQFKKETKSNRHHKIACELVHTDMGKASNLGTNIGIDRVLGRLYVAD